MTKRYLTSIVLLAIVPGLSLAQQRAIVVSDGVSPIEAAHIVVDGTPLTVTDSSGIAYLRAEDCRGEIVVSHLLYQELRFKAPGQDTAVIIHARRFSLDSLSYHYQDDKDFLKERLHKGLRVSRSSTPTPVYALDTLSSADNAVVFKANGTAAFLFRHRNPVVDLKEFSMSIETGRKELRRYSKMIEEDISHHTGNALAYALLICFERESDGFLVDYLGEDGDDLVFKFYITPQYADGEYKAKGMMVLGKTDGILHRITATLSPVGNTLSIPYDLDVRFSYDEKEKTILPSDLTYITYYTNSDRQTCLPGLQRD